MLFLSRHPSLLGLAVETIKYLVELRGWRGVANQNCHARDVRIYLEDPGSWLIAINTELRSIVKPAREVCVVDLDINFVKCARPPSGVPSSKATRDRMRRRVVNALGFSSADHGPVSLGRSDDFFFFGCDVKAAHMPFAPLSRDATHSFF